MTPFPYTDSCLSFVPWILHEACLSYRTGTILRPVSSFVSARLHAASLLFLFTLLLSLYLLAERLFSVVSSVLFHLYLSAECLFPVVSSALFYLLYFRPDAYASVLFQLSANQVLSLSVS